MRKLLKASLLLLGCLTLTVPCSLADDYDAQNGQTPGLSQSDWQTLPATNNTNSGPSPQAGPVNQVNGQTPGLSQSDWQAAQSSQSSWQSPQLGQSQWQTLPTAPQFSPQPNQAQWQPQQQSSGWPTPQQGSWQSQQMQRPNQGWQNPLYGQTSQSTLMPNQYQEPGAYLNQGQGGSPYNDQYQYASPPANINQASALQTNNNSNAQNQPARNNNGGLVSGITQALGVGLQVAAPLAGAYMMSRAINQAYSNPFAYRPPLPFGYGLPSPAMPYGYPGYPSPYGLGGLSSFFHY